MNRSEIACMDRVCKNRGNKLQVPAESRRKMWTIPDHGLEAGPSLSKFPKGEVERRLGFRV